MQQQPPSIEEMIESIKAMSGADFVRLRRAIKSRERQALMAYINSQETQSHPPQG